LVLLGLLGWHIHARAKPPGAANLGDRALLAITGPIQKGLSNVASGATSLVSNYFNLVGVNEENKRISRDLSYAIGALGELDELRLENERLRQLQGLRSRVPGRTVGASVIGRGVSSRFHTLRIDRGARAGLRHGQSVIASQGAVGQVLRVSEHFADVLVLTDGLSTVGVVLQESRQRGLAAGQGGEFLELGFVRRREMHAIEAGDLVVTSGEDDLFPEGIPLGRVTEVTAPETGLFLEVTMEPVVDLGRVDEVLVIVDSGIGPFHFPKGWPGAPLEASPVAMDDAPAFAEPHSVAGQQGSGL